MPEEIDRYLLQVEADLNSINQSHARLGTIIKDQQIMTDNAKKMGAAGEQSGKKLVAAYKAVADAAEKARVASEKSRKEAERSLSTKDAFGKASTGVGSFASVASGVAGSGAAEGLRLVGDVSGAAEQIPALVSSIGALGPVGIAGGAAVAGLALILGSAISETQRLTEATKKRLDAEAEITRLATTGTREELTARRDAIAEQLAGERRVFEQRNEELQQVTAGLDVFDQFRETVNLAFGEVDGLRDKQTESLDTIRSLTSAFNDAELALVQNTTAANDLAAAEAELAAERQKQADQFVNTQIATLIKAQSLNSEQAKERLEAIADETAAIERFNQTMGQSAGNQEALQARLDNLATEYTLLQTLLPTLISHNDELARQKKELEESEKAFKATAAAQESFNKDITSLEERTAEARISINERLAQVAVDLAEKQAEALTSRNDDLIELDRSAAKERAKNAAQANEDQLAEEQRHKDALKQIDSDFNSAKRTGVQNRDVLAVKAAEEARAAARESEAKNNKDRLSEIDKALSEQNAAVDDKLKEQTATIEKRYREQTDAARKASDKAREAIRADLSAIDSKYAQELLKRNAHHITELSLLAAHYTTRETLERQHLERLNAQAQQYLSGSSSNGSSGRGGTPSALSPISLPSAPQGFSSRGGNSGGGGGGNNITIPISINGIRQRELVARTADEVKRQIDYIFKEAGVN